MLVVASPEDDFPTLWGDEDLLVRALSELVENAIIFCGDGGTIWLAARRADGEIAIDVHDDGPGIAAEELSRILASTFYRGEIGESGHIPGIGLGLAIARLIVEGHDGQLLAESSDTGSTFTIQLPAVTLKRPGL